ncbi:hypothetical protein ACERZ8_09705 [Tateyamaria armeniaca]|uniref:Uncharacterized protein n=1 Tax=Tateyamaria armeniaca TaxID=2518930 RepID=A0ABW8USM3_9RHOB
MRFFCLVFLLAGLASCGAVPPPAEPEFEPEPIPQFEPDNIGPWCGYAARVLANPDAEPAQKTAVDALARERGCSI